MFEQSSELRADYMALIAGAITAPKCDVVMVDAIAVIHGCKSEIVELYTGRVHGASQHARLDLLDLWKSNARKMKAELIK